MTQHLVNVVDPASYERLLAGHRAAICTLGVGQPSIPVATLGAAIANNLLQDQDGLEVLQWDRFMALAK